MKFKFLAVFGPVILVANLSLATELKVPAIPEGEARVFKSYYATKRDRPDLKNWLMRAVVAFAPGSYISEVRWKGEGEGRQLVYTRKAELNNKATADLIFTFDTSPEFKLHDYRRVIHAPDGTELSNVYYDYTEPSLRYPENTFHVFVGNMVLRGSDLTEGLRLPWNVWLTPMAVYPFRYKVVGEETITVPAGTFECYKVVGRLVPEGLTDLTGIILSKVVGKYYFWVEKGGAHGFVRLLWPLSSGLIPGVRTRYQTQDLIEIREEK